MESQKIWYVIPTYWTGDKAGAFSSIYDHPTPIGSGESTLSRLLASIVKAFKTVPDGEATVLVLVSTVDAEDCAAAVAWVKKICAPFFEDLQILIAGEDVAEALIEADDVESSKDSLFRNGLRGYGDVRNLQLILPAVFGAEWIFSIDDDEIISDTTVKRVLWHVKNNTKDGVAGLYLNEDGGYLLNASSELDDVENVLVDKGIYMNATFEALQAENAKGVLPVSPLALGGNMLFPKEMFLEVCFDPYITRGEDIDYLINAKGRRKHFRFDDQLTILHLPPRHLEADDYAKMKADVIRFVYERAKLAWSGLNVDVFYDYPGRLFEDEFEEAALIALNAIVNDERAGVFGTPTKVIDEANDYAMQFLTKFETFAEDWFIRLQAWGAKEDLLAKIWELIG